LESADLETLRKLRCKYRVEFERDLGILNIEFRSPKKTDLEMVARLRRRRPHTVSPSRLIQEHGELDISHFGPVDLYAGSGLSYEAGIPMLSTVHEAFGVDDPCRGQFLFGSDDPIPEAIAVDPLGMFRQMVDVDLACIFAVPSKSHFVISDLYKRSWIGKIFTDNIDDLFEQSGLPHIATRGAGIFNEPVQVRFSSVARSLLVVGVSADRRSVIREARRRGLRIVVINPCYPVSPQARNLDYLCDGDIFLRCTAAEALLPLSA
jgi:hypothetical protein